jgi:hypothetical protein
VNRRNFLGVMFGGVAAAAARTFPFRVFSFPSEVKPLTALDIYLALQAEAFPDGFSPSDLRYVNVDGGVLPPPYYIGTMFDIAPRTERPIVCAKVDPVSRVITWGSL